MYKHTALVRMAIVAALLTWFASPGRAQTTPPDFSVQVWGDIVEDFNRRVSRYFELRRSLEKDVVPLIVTEDPGEIERAETALARKLRVARARAKQGEIFSPAIQREFRRALRVEIDAVTWAALMDDNPGSLSRHVNGTYPRGEPLAMMPPNILAQLPELPDNLEYRFLGRHLILHDRRANVIVDWIPDAIRCNDCEKLLVKDNAQQ